MEKMRREAFFPTSPYYHRQKNSQNNTKEGKPDLSTLQPAATVSRLISARCVSVPHCDCQREQQQTFFFFCCSAIISTTSTIKKFFFFLFFFTHMSREYFDT